MKLRSFIEILGHHGIKSFIGVARGMGHPWFTLKLLLLRMLYSITSRLWFHVIDPKDFVIDSADALTSYWNNVIERELDHRSWVGWLRINQDAVVVDVGANTGSFLARVFEINPQADVIAIEPQACLMPRLLGIIGKFRSAKLIVKAVSNSPGMISMYRRRSGDSGASIVFGRNREPTEHLYVASMRLDQLELSHIDLLKIDVEGAGVQAVVSAHGIKDKIKFILVELERPVEAVEIWTYLGGGWGMTRVGPSDYLYENKKASRA